MLFAQEPRLNSSIFIPSHLLERFLLLQNRNSQILQKIKPRTEAEINPVALRGRSRLQSQAVLCLPFSPDLGTFSELHLQRIKCLLKPKRDCDLWVFGILTHASSWVRGGLELVQGFLLNFARLSEQMQILLCSSDPVGLGSGLMNPPALRGDSPSVPGCRRALWKCPAPFLAWVRLHHQLHKALFPFPW